MAIQKLNLSRDQLASFLQDFEQIKQFENLFSTVDTISTVTIDEIGIAADSAFATANEALSGIATLNDLVAPLVVAPPPTGGTVTSVNLTAGTGISVSGGPITSSGSITVVNTAPDQIVSLTGAGTTSITGTYPSFTITSNDAYVGTVTSVSGTGTVNGITLTGTVTSSGSLSLGGTLSGVSLTSQVSGTLPVANGGTGQTSYTNGQLLIGNTTGNTLTPATLTAGANITITNGTGSISIAVSGLGTMAFQNVGVSGSFTTADIPPKTVTVTNGIITNIV